MLRQALRQKASLNLTLRILNLDGFRRSAGGFHPTTCLMTCPATNYQIQFHLALDFDPKGLAEPKQYGFQPLRTLFWDKAK